MSENKPLTISAEDMKALQRQDPFITFEQVPIVEVRMMCLEMIGGLGRCFPGLAEWVPGWLKYFLEREDARFASRLLNVWLFHPSHTSETLASAVDSALAIAAEPQFACKDITIETFSREVCSRVRRDISVYWNTPRLHRFLFNCLNFVSLRWFSIKEESIVRRALRIICEAEDASVLSHLCVIRSSFNAQHKRELEEPVRGTFALLDKIWYKEFVVALGEYFDYLAGFIEKDVAQWREFNNQLQQSAGRIGIQNLVLLQKYPSIEQKNSAGPITVGLAIGGAEELKDKSQLMKLIDGVTVTLIGDGIKNSQVCALTPASPSVTGGTVGSFNQDLECLFRLEGLEGKKRYRLLVHATKPVPEISPTLLCTLTGYANFA